MPWAESVITVDAEGRIDYVNRAAETLLGRRFDEIISKSFVDVASLVDEKWIAARSVIPCASP